MKVKRGMSSAMIHHVTLVMLLVFALPIQTVQGGLSHAECKLLVNILVSACSEVINRKPPSDYCCQRIRVTPEECVCPRITPQLAVLIPELELRREDRSGLRPARPSPPQVWKHHNSINESKTWKSKHSAVHDQNICIYNN
ncbi:hypothetical protein Syun_002927 [Stephania yunnanensis]|uniref:Bifunctional inhibitor/plant lipid transfer protein/seed storage helical domain-containing protein n=1 Tax=Stephania yunnanensis TaxID=152371 RepID=A0AAP0Q056_9MAGN